jgi:hypothetical protein
MKNIFFSIFNLNSPMGSNFLTQKVVCVQQDLSWVTDLLQDITTVGQSAIYPIAACK